MSPAVAGSPRRAPAARWPLQPPRWRSAPPRAAAPRAPRAEAPPTRREGPTGHGLERAQTASRRSCWWSARRRRPQRTEYARTALRACVSSLARRCTHLTVHRCHQLWLPQIGVGCLGKGIAQAALLERVAHRAVEYQPARSHSFIAPTVAVLRPLLRREQSPARRRREDSCNAAKGRGTHGGGGLSTSRKLCFWRPLCIGRRRDGLRQR